MKKISIIIRTKNEEKWISKCLQSISNQKVNAEVETILVDNNSSDKTVEIAKIFNINKIVKIDNFLPGKAINLGINASNGDYIVCISAHCIPENSYWLDRLLINFKQNKNLAGVYGRQLPLGFTDPIDKRDLLTVFGKDKIIQKKGHFFHNANSMIPRNIWKKFPFDEKVTNIEDRVWGKQVIDNGYEIIYEPEAAVFHFHGLHHGNDRKRFQSVVSIIEKVDRLDPNELPEILSPKNTKIFAIVPVSKNISKIEKQINSFDKLILELKESAFVDSIFCISNEKILAEKHKINWIDRKLIKNEQEISLDLILKKGLEIIESKRNFCDKILYANYDYQNRPEGIFDELIKDAQYKGCDTIFPGLIDYGHYWYNDNDEIKQTDPSLAPRSSRNPIYKALYGIGCISACYNVRSGKLVNGKIGIFKLPETLIDVDKRLK